MAKIIKLSKFKKQENKAKESEFHPDNQKYWNRVIDNMTIAHFGTLNPNTKI
jgi:hypothetical protein